MPASRPEWRAAVEAARGAGLASVEHLHYPETFLRAARKTAADLERVLAGRAPQAVPDAADAAAGWVAAAAPPAPAPAVDAGGDDKRRPEDGDDDDEESYDSEEWQFA